MPRHLLSFEITVQRDEFRHRERAGSPLRAEGGLVGARARGPGAHDGGARVLAGAVDLACGGVGGGGGDGVGGWLRAGAHGVWPAGRDEGLWLVGRSAGGAGGALGRGVVPGDRPLRLPPGTGRVHVVAPGVLPAVPGGTRGDRVAGRPAGGGGGRAVIAWRRPRAWR